MAITKNDIKFVTSAVMDDVPEGGGAPTGHVVVDGLSNEIFSDISEVDRAGGNVSMRKIFVSVDTNDTDTYLDGNVIVAQPPTDPNVSVTLFSTKETFDARESAKQRVEAYLAEGPEWAGFLLENHISGQRVIQIFQRPTEAVPNIGETLVLIYHEGLSDERQQFVRVIDTSSVERTYTTPQGKTYQAVVVSADISDALRFDFPGTAPNEFFARHADASKLRETSVADAAVYSGVVATTQQANIGDLTAKVSSIFTQLVPSAQTEIPLVDINAAGSSTALTPAGDGTVSYTTSVVFDSITALSLGNPVTPGTLSIVIGSATLTDTGGQLFDGATAVGVVDYARGVVTFPTLSVPYSGSKTISFKVSAAPVRIADTGRIDVTPESRSFNYIVTIIPAPTPGSVLVSYRAQGRWYDLRDNGGGVLRGSDNAFGVGSVNYATGSASVTLGALPDVGSAVVFSWATKVNYIDRSTMSVDPASITATLTALPVVPGTVSITWDDGTARTAVDDSNGLLTGDAAGTIDYETGVVKLRPANLPLGGQEYAFAYDNATGGGAKSASFTDPIRNGDTTVTLDLGATDVKPGTVRLDYSSSGPHNQIITGGPSAYIEYYNRAPRTKGRDDGNGNIICELGRVAGTINYATGIITFQPDGPVFTQVRTVENTSPLGLIQWTSRGTTYPPEGRNATLAISGSDVQVVFQAGGTSAPQSGVDYTPGNVVFDLTNRFAEQIVPGSVNFTLAGKKYFDRLGELYTDIEVTTGAATLAGSINYSTGVVTLSTWVSGQPNTLSLNALLTTAGDNTVSQAAFRVPVSPVRPGSLQIIATKEEGGTINVTAGIDGTISGTGIRGTVGYETGVVSVQFGELVTAAGNEDEPWYHASNVEGDDVWKPAMVFAETLKFNAVAFSYLPLDADLIGLDPVRLPQDGRVPIFRKGGFAVIGHTQTTAPATVVDDQTVDLGRVRLSRVRVIGADGETIDTGYTEDLEAGTVTFTDVTGYSQPVTIEDRIEDLAQISDVQISGDLAFTRPVTHLYPVGSYVSSALMTGDLKARVSVLFDQTTWDSVTWSDAVVGSAALASYNATLSPVEVANRGAVTERWALKFTSTTAFQVIGEHVGVIETSSINVDTAPLNPATGTPYFTIRALGWGSGWAVGNVVRMNTVGAQFPVWAVRTVQQGAETVLDDTFELLIRGDVDHP